MSESKPTAQRTVTVSCPGKVLVAGGYLVLESPNEGCTIASSSRFHATAAGAHRDGEELATSIDIAVDSPQFHESYEYSFNIESAELSRKSDASNGFVEKCLVMTLRFINRYSEVTPQGSLLRKWKSLRMTLNADNDFYSQTSKLLQDNKPLTSASLGELDRFLPCPKNAEGKVEIAKTGLGSSATLVTSVVGSLLAFFGVISLAEDSSQEDCRIVHNLAQLVHSHAQGKIGSGFDVSAAVYGSQLYQRFEQGPFEHCLHPEVTAEDLYNAVVSKTLWTQRVVPFELPEGFDIVLGDVCGGAASASMAREVLKMKNSSSDEFSALWQGLRDTNHEIATAMMQLGDMCKDSVDAFRSAIQRAATSRVEELKGESNSTELLQLMVRVRALFQAARASLKRMGELAGVGIEPPSQTELVDATIKLPGVLAAGVPGAGGNDAIFALIIGEEARQQVENLWSTWHHQPSHPPVCALVMRAGIGGMKVKST